MSFGIVAIGESLGELVDVTDSVIKEYAADDETVRSWGYRHFHRAGDGVLLTDLAVQACEEALKAASMDASEVDLVVLAIADFAEYLCWDAAVAVQGRIGAVRAEAILINQACCSGVMAFDTVAGRFATHENYQNALIVSSNRICDAYQNRMEPARACCRTAPWRHWCGAATSGAGGWPPRRSPTAGTPTSSGWTSAAPPSPSARPGRPVRRGCGCATRSIASGRLFNNDARQMLEFVRKFGGNMRMAVGACLRPHRNRCQRDQAVHPPQRQPEGGGRHRPGAGRPPGTAHQRPGPGPRPLRRGRPATRPAPTDAGRRAPGRRPGRTDHPGQRDALGRHPAPRVSRRRRGGLNVRAARLISRSVTRCR